METTQAADFAQELGGLFRRDLTRLVQELKACTDDDLLWRPAPGVSNSVGNLTLHLEGNLREYVGRQLGGVPYVRKRDAEFATTDLAAADLIARIESLRELIPGIILALPKAVLDQVHPENVLGIPVTTRQFLLSLYGHLNYHLGQIDYLRRILAPGKAIDFAGL